MAEPMLKTTLLITGMHSNSCREQVVEALWGMSGVEDVAVSLIRSTAVVVHRAPCDIADLVLAVVSAGFGATIDGTGT